VSLLRGHWQLAAIIIAVFLLWTTPVMIPLKILVVFLHELSHAMTAVFTGGDIISISVSPAEGGEAWTRGGSRFLTLSAGYLGSLLIGLALLWVALRTNLDRYVMVGLGIILLVITALYMRDLFAISFGAIGGIALLVAARFLPIDVNDLILRVIGLTSMIYVPYDIFSDTIARSALQSDARMLAEEFGGPTIMWGGMWLIMSLVLIGFTLRHLLGQATNLTFGTSRKR
jgi:hypothetical protein